MLSYGAIPENTSLNNLYIISGYKHANGSYGGQAGIFCGNLKIYETDQD